jgi:Fe-S cluster assembly iron-binding protein IscA
MALDESKDKKENLTVINDTNVVIDKDVNELLENGAPLTIGYYKNSYAEGFTIDNGSMC